MSLGETGFLDGSQLAVEGLWRRAAGRVLVKLDGLVRMSVSVRGRKAWMVVTATEYKHIQLDERGVAFIAGSTMKVVELVTSHLADDWNPEELHIQYPHLSLGQIHSALAYYWDHQGVMDTEIQRQFEFAETLRKQASSSPIRDKLRAKGLLT